MSMGIEINAVDVRCKHGQLNGLLELEGVKGSCQEVLAANDFRSRVFDSTKGKKIAPN